MPQYFGKLNETEVATVTASVAVTNEDNLKSRFVEKVSAFTSASSLSIFLNWGGVVKTISSLALYGHNGLNEPGATVKFVLWDGETGAGSIVRQSSALPADPGYQVGSGFGDFTEPAQVLHDFTEQSEDRLVPSIPQGKSIEIQLATTGAFAWRVGYVWAGPSIALSTDAKLGEKAGRQVQIKSRTQQAQGGGVTFQDDENISVSRLEYPVLSIADADTLEDLSKSVGVSAPFYFRRHPETTTPLSRKAEGGIVRLTQALKLPSLGAQVNQATDKSKLTATDIAVWR